MKISKISAKLVRDIGTLSMISKVIALSLILATAPVGIVQVNADQNQDIIKTNADASTNVKVAFSQAYPLYIEQREAKSFQLVESGYDRLEREKRQREEADNAKVQNDRKSAKREVLARDYRPAHVDADLATKRALAKRAAAKYGIDWKILEAVWQVESGKAWDTAIRSYAGAGGPLQFMPSTWRNYAQDGNGDGQADMYCAEDAVFGAAQLLAQSGAAWGDIDSALLAYNHAQWYVDKVKAVANSIE